VFRFWRHLVFFFLLFFGFSNFFQQHAPARSLARWVHTYIHYMHYIWISSIHSRSRTRTMG